MNSMYFYWNRINHRRSVKNIR